MKRSTYAILVLALVLTACGGESPDEPLGPPETADPVDHSTVDASPDAAMTGKVELKFFGDAAGAEEAQLPTFEVSSNKFSMLDDGAWVLEQAVAIIYGAQDEDDARVTAGRCHYDDKAKTAVLTENATMELGTKRVKMEDMTWSDADGLAVTDKPVDLAFEDSRLSAKTLKYRPADALLTLTTVTGAVVMPAKGEPGAADASAISGLTFNKPAPLVEFGGGNLKKMSGGVEVELQSSDADAERQVLSAKAIEFTWSDADPPAPERIDLNERVRVTGPQGDIESDQAVLDLAKDALRFSGHVRGKTDQVPQFEADSLVYDLAGGKSDMTNLRAKNVPVQADRGEGGFSAMDIDRAPEVVFTEGKVERMSGGVRITLRSADPKTKPFKLAASEVTFDWPAGGGSPSAIHLRGSVAVDSPEGRITSERADFDMAKESLVFVGNVVGSTPEIEEFQTDKIVYNIASGDSVLTNLRAQDVPVSQGEEAAPDATKTNYSTMDIVKAPVVLMQAGRFKKITGGVEILLKPDDPEKKPMALSGKEMGFTFEDTPTPTEVILTGDVVVDAAEAHIEANEAELDMESKQLTFSGDVEGDLPGIKGLQASEIVYDLTTGNVSMSGASADQLDKRRDEAPELLRVEDVADWPALIAALQTQAAAEKPSPGRRIADLLKPEYRRQFAGLPRDQEFDADTKKRIVKRLNGLLLRDDFYDAAAWDAIPLPPRATELTKQPVEELKTAERNMLNRMLLEAAFPKAIRVRPVGEQDGGAQ
ncbi:MAG: hypothetical protein GY851_36890 [bacterium]|nr:hypothetical protein [bacterium]